MTKQMLSRQEAAAMLGVSVPTVGRMVADGLLRGHRIGRRLVRIPQREIVDYLNRHCIGKGENKEASDE